MYAFVSKLPKRFVEWLGCIDWQFPEEIGIVSEDGDYQVSGLFTKPLRIRAARFPLQFSAMQQRGLPVLCFSFTGRERRRQTFEMNEDVVSILAAVAVENAVDDTERIIELTMDLVEDFFLSLVDESYEYSGIELSSWDFSPDTIITKDLSVAGLVAELKMVYEPKKRFI